MKIAGVGIDMVALRRVERLTSRNEDIFRLRILGETERREIPERSAAHQRHAGYACSIAAKEAFLKALGSGLRPNDRWPDIEVVDRHSGKPRLELSGEPRKRMDGLGVEMVHFSMSVVRTHAIAAVVLAV